MGMEGDGKGGGGREEGVCVVTATGFNSEMTG